MISDRGQGVNNAIQDAANFVDALVKIKDGASVEQVMAAYDDEILERGQREIALSITQTIASHSVETFVNGPLATIGLKQKVEGS
jgi:2-polyprenyl-6-methoxyphenol hydroxylase-like FAD-dependent oxidoreductase